MKKPVLFVLSFLLFFLTACSSVLPEEETVVSESIPVTVPATADIPDTAPTETVTVPADPVMVLTDKEKTMLLKLGMAERGDTGCTTCIALVMRTVLNRVEDGAFGSSIRSVISAPGQFTPVTDGSYYSAEPNAQCHEALEMVITGWDESQGALFYEWCEGECWHSKSLHLLFQHCDARFYD